VLQGFAES